jgi:hypothetical protein
VQRPALVAEVALQLSEDGGGGVARELRPATGLEAIDGLDQAEARDLEQVVERLVGVGVAKREVAGQRQEALDELLPRDQIAVVVVADEQLPLGLTGILAVSCTGDGYGDAGRTRWGECDCTHLSLDLRR